ncbi:MAG TPA: hypothetical protein VIV40_14630 [Kofleriaceae bacterium]
MRSALCAVLLSGCLIVHADEQEIEEPCPDAKPVLLAEGRGPFVLGDAIYFVGSHQTISRVDYGGAISELTGDVGATALVGDATDLYWAGNGVIVRKPFDAGPYVIAEGYSDVTRMVIDDTSVAWASSSGLDRWSKADQTIEHLDDASLIAGLGVWAGRYYYTDTHNDRIRRAPPVEDLAVGHFPGPLVVDERGVYYFEAGNSDELYGGALHLVPREGGIPVTTADHLARTWDLTEDYDHLVFATSIGAAYRIKQVSRFGGTVHTLACGEYGGMLYVGIAGDYVYWADYYGLYQLDRRSVGGL